MSLRIGKETKFMLAGQSLNLTSNRAMRSFYGHILKICHPKHLKTIFVVSKWGQSLQKSDIEKKNWHKAFG